MIEPGHRAATGRLSGEPAVVPADLGPTGPVPVGPVAAAYVPASGRPRRLVVALHGAGGTPDDSIRVLRPVADAANLLLLAPASAGRTWDMIVGGFGPDVLRIDRAVAAVPARYQVRPGPYVVSDGSQRGVGADCRQRPRITE